MKCKVFALLLLLFSVSCLFADDDVPKRDYWPTIEWRSSSPRKQGMDARILKEIDAHVEKTLPFTSSVLVVRHGYIVFERYYDGSPNKRRTMWCATKGVLSSLVGIAIQEGYLTGVSQRMMEFFPEFADDQINPEALKVSLHDLLTMSDGISHWEMDYIFDKQVLASKFRTAPGTESYYNSMSPQIISMILTKATGGKAVDFATEHLFQPLGILDFYWENAGVYSRGAYGLALRTRDMAKIGYLYLNMGMWNEKELVPVEWVRESTKYQITNHQFTEYYRDYGYYWWIHPMASHYSYYAEGSGGQFIVVAPDLDLVVIVTSNEVTLDDEKYLSIITDKVVPSVRH